MCILIKLNMKSNKILYLHFNNFSLVSVSNSCNFGLSNQSNYEVYIIVFKIIHVYYIYDVEGLYVLKQRNEPMFHAFYILHLLNQSVLSFILYMFCICKHTIFLPGTTVSISWSSLNNRSHQKKQRNCNICFFFYKLQISLLPPIAT